VANSDYSKKLKAIRPFINFNYDLRKQLTKSDKAKITKYFNLVKKYKQNSHHVYYPRNIKNKDIALKYAGQKKDRNLKAVFIPGKGHIRIKVKNGRLQTYSTYVHSDFYPLDPLQLIKDPDKAINRILEKRPDVEYWGIVTERGDGSIDTLGEVSHKKFILRQIKRLAAKYGDQDMNNFMGNWLHGLQAMEFTEQADAQSFKRAKKKAKKKKWHHSKLIRK